MRCTVATRYVAKGTVISDGTRCRLELSRRGHARVCACQLHKSRRNDIRLREEGGHPTICRTSPSALRAYRTHVLLRRCATVNWHAKLLGTASYISFYRLSGERNINSILNKYTARYINSCLVFTLFRISSAPYAFDRGVSMIYSGTWIRISRVQRNRT